MFDVPPPDDGVRDIAAYGRDLAARFEWQRSGASFKIVSLDVTARRRRRFRLGAPCCGTPDESERDPEHHSFPDKS